MGAKEDAVCHAKDVSERKQSDDVVIARVVSEKFVYAEALVVETV